MSDKTKVFVEKATSIHGDKYDYSNVKYQKALCKVEIVCKKHGSFFQTPNNHLRGKGCRSCNNSPYLDTKSFIQKSKAIHGDKYDYTSTTYVRAKDKVTIRCPKHGDFQQIPYSHMAGKGCIKCRGESTSKLKTLNVADFVMISNKVHGHRYSYAKSKYSSSKSKITVTCHTHGDFEQEAGSHMRGTGCPSCMFRREAVNHVYLLASPTKVKIGVSVDPDRRFRTLKVETPFDFKVVGVWRGEGLELAFSVERMLHDYFKDRNSGLSGFDGATEWFDINPDEPVKLLKMLLGDPTPCNTN